MIPSKFFLKSLIGRTGHGIIGGFPPSTWRFSGTRNGTCIMEHVKHPSQSNGFSDQGVSEDDVLRILGVTQDEVFTANKR